MRFHFQWPDRSHMIRVSIGSFFGALLSIIMSNSVAIHTLRHIPYIDANFGESVFWTIRIPWYIAMAMIIGAISALVTIGVHWYEEPFSITIQSALITLGVTSLYNAVFDYMGAQPLAFFPGYFLFVVGNFMMVALSGCIPFLLVASLTIFLTQWTHKSRSMADIFPPELLERIHREGNQS
jgi:hypothetical protein